MAHWLSPPFSHLVAGLLLGVSILSAVLLVQRCRRAFAACGLHRAQWILRALRCLLVGLTAALWAAAFISDRPWLLMVGLVVLGQELYEGVVLGALLRRGRLMEGERTPCR